MITTQDVTLFCQKEFLKMITPTSSKYKHMHAVVCYCSPLALTVVSELTAEICVLQTVNKNIDWETRKLRDDSCVQRCKISQGAEQKTWIGLHPAEVN